MSDIPLRTFGRSRSSRSGYTPLNTEQDEYNANGSRGVDNNNHQTMPLQTNVTRAAISGANQNHQRWKGKKKQTYQDDPEEHEGLLGDDQHHDSEDEVGRPGPARLPTHEVWSTPHNAWLWLTSSSDRLRGRLLAGSMRAIQKTSLELCHSDPQVCFGDSAASPTKLIRLPLRKTPITVHSKHRQKSEIQRIHFPTYRILRAVQVFLQPIFLAGRPFAVCSCA